MLPSKYIIDEAISQAQLSTHRFRVGAVIYHRNDQISSGFNDAVKTHPRSPHPWKSRHAEFSAVLEAMRTFELDNRSIAKQCSIYVHRLLADGSPGLARPCKWCQGMLDQLGINKIYWSESGTF